MADDKDRIIIRGAEALNIRVTAASHTVVDEKDKVLFERKK